MKLLIVDDQILYRQNLVTALSHQPDMFVLGEACSVREAVEMTYKLKPEVMLMNINLSNGAGWDTVRCLLGKCPDLKLVFLVSQDDNEQFLSAIRMGVKGYLHHSLPLPKLIMALRGLERGEAAISREMAAHLMLEMSHASNDPGTPNEPFGVLTAREQQVLHELVANATNREIAERLFISENTVRNHVHKILEKLNFKNRREVVHLARQRGLDGVFSKRGGN